MSSYMGYYKPPAPPRPPRQQPVGSGSAIALARAAAGQGGFFGLSGGTGFGTAPRTPTGPQAPNVASHASQYASSVTPSGPRVAPAPTPTVQNSTSPYSLETDPALQQIKSLVGLNNDQANAAALKQREDLLLGYGDPAIASSVLGASDPIVAAAAGNPTSTVAQLGQQRDRNLKSLDDQLNAANLTYSGYRVNQEQQAAQDFQNALAQAAAGLRGNLGTVDANLASQLSANNAQEAQAISDAAARAQAQAAATGIDPGAITFDPSGQPLSTSSTPLPADLSGLAAAASGLGPTGPSDAGAPANTGALTAPLSTVGLATDPALYQLLGRKTDPRYAGI